MVRLRSPAPIMGDFPSGQRGQTVNLLSLTSVVRIHHPPPSEKHCTCSAFLLGRMVGRGRRCKNPGDSPLLPAVVVLAPEPSTRGEEVVTNPPHRRCFFAWWRGRPRPPIQEPGGFPASDRPVRHNFLFHTGGALIPPPHPHRRACCILHNSDGVFSPLTNPGNYAIIEDKK